MRRLIKVCWVFSVALAIGPYADPAFAQKWPEKPIHLIVPFGPGSFPDIVARLLSQKMSEGLGQPVVVENRVGAGGNIGTEAVVRARPDGYTLLLNTVANAINKSLYRKLSFDPVKDLTPISQVASVSNVLVVPASLNANSLPELLDLALKRRPGLSFASGGNGTTCMGVRRRRWFE